jgi:hypothetical protein
MSNRTINEAFASVFGGIREQRTFASMPNVRPSEKTHDEACIKAAISKCIDFNVTVNRQRDNYDEAFLLIAGLRGVAEDLIILKYTLNFTAEIRGSYFNKLMALNRSEGILAQKRFFETNNPFQLVVGSEMGLDQAENEVEIARNDLKTFWKSQGSLKKNGPNVRDMAEAVKLKDTYEYIYFAASNFVHFNPHALMRTGWGPEGGPFTFSIGNFGGYYRDLAAVYGAILYIGFAATFGPLLGDQQGFNQEISAIENILVKTPRWPELVTFEELNIKAPLHMLLHAIREGTRERGQDFAFFKILNEIKGLPAVIPASNEPKV